jgi:hypothetical protein
MTLRLLFPVASLVLLISLAVIPSDATAQDVRPRPHVTRKAQAPPPPGTMTSRRDPNSPDSPSRQGNQSGGQNQQQAEIVVETAHPYWLEAVIFCGLAGGALFLICRSAGRV